MKAQKGFTLIEMTIVLLILAILIGGISLYASAYKRDTITSGTAQYIADWKKALARYYSIYTSYPATTTTNNFDQNFMRITPLEGVSLDWYNPSYTGGTCSSEPAVKLTFEDSATTKVVKTEMDKRGFKVCEETTTSLTISVRP